MFCPKRVQPGWCHHLAGVLLVTHSQPGRCVCWFALRSASSALAVSEYCTERLT
jgi:hypothetical protein